MSHQDRPVPLGINHQTMKQVMDWLLTPAVFASLPGRKEATWKPRLLAATAVVWATSELSTVHERFAQARKLITKVFRWHPAPGGSQYCSHSIIQSVLLSPRGKRIYPTPRKGEPLPEGEGTPLAKKCEMGGSYQGFLKMLDEMAARAARRRGAVSPGADAGRTPSDGGRPGATRCLPGTGPVSRSRAVPPWKRPLRRNAGGRRGEPVSSRQVRGECRRHKRPPPGRRRPPRPNSG